ncbi:hemerythrin domain-containing protein [Mesorhizobium humile]|jgi:hemerythrin-like domain-containing protein|uniref:Hemerythrin domain-containing protein n=1 Tax=Mesorhizobium humile TaxID=3072313 RepID=A0ABU4YPV6_9HYPH|nr:MULTISPECIES: hemerythrin domain-containing protein [unclassified Mesorhizobium]MDX8461349.1 hemerythrin domain-containing protein [Mesorhizobium sp. VK2D]MDX8488959.1 hemerythrin domain-containing protein [Mesorhizobium sp. VK2B]
MTGERSEPLRSPADMRRAHVQKLALCHILEGIADDLPSRVDRLQCLAVAADLLPLLRECHRFEEEVVFPVFARQTGEEDTVERLKLEHLEDESAAADLSEALLVHGHGRPIENPEAFGYMLRAFFESMRRHIAFERDHVLPEVLGDP